jgi:hypothetical protein
MAVINLSKDLTVWRFELALDSLDYLENQP